MGRPLWEPTPENINQIEAYASLGLTNEQISDCIGISRQTLNEKRKEYPDISDALKRGKAKGLAMYADLLLKNAKKGNAASIIFYLKVHGKWNDGDQKVTNDEIRKEQMKNRREKAQKWKPEVT